MSVSTQPWLSIILIAALMFLDYYLTLKGQALGKKEYYKHVKIETYELNPTFRGHVSAGTYTIKHFLLVILNCALLFGAYFLTTQNNQFFTATTYDFMRGILLSMFIYINCRHLQNIMLFKKLNKEPKLLSGTLKQAHAFSLHAGKAHAYTTALLLFALWAFNPTWLTFGFALGPFFVGRKHKGWAKKK